MSGRWREGIIQSGASRRRKMSANGSGFWKVHTTLFGLEHFHVRRDKQRFSFWSCKSGRCLCQQNWNTELKKKIEINVNVLTHYSNSDILRCPLSFLNWKQWSLMGFCVYFFFFFSLKNESLFQKCVCRTTQLLLYPAAYFMSLILQRSPALLNTWPCWRACFQQAIWTHALPTALHISPSLAHCSLR